MNDSVQVPAIYKAIHELMVAVKDVPKNGEFNGGRVRYSFRGIEDMITHVGAAAREFGVMLQSRVVREESGTATVNTTLWTTCRLTMEYRFTSLVDGSFVSFESIGEGRDAADKASSKAMSMALKYALGQALLIGTGDPDPDASRPGDPEAGHAYYQAPPVPREDPAELAQRALTAARSAVSVAGLRKISGHALELGISDQMIEGSPLGDHFTAIEATLTDVPTEES